MPTIQNRRATAAQWTAANPVLAAGEIGFELDTNSVKIGDGLTPWETLSYLSDESLSELIETGRLSESVLNGTYVSADDHRLQRAGASLMSMLAQPVTDVTLERVSAAKYYLYSNLTGDRRIRWTLQERSPSQPGTAHQIEEVHALYVSDDTTVLQVTTVDENGEASITWSGSWVNVGYGTPVSGMHGGSLRRTSEAGAYAEWVTPTATYVGVLASRVANCGIAKVTVDGSASAANLLPTAQDLVTAGALASSALVANGGTLDPADRVVDLYSPTTKYATDVPIAEGLTEVPHTVRVTATGYKNAAALDVRVEVDAYTYGVVTGGPVETVERLHGVGSVWEYAFQVNAGGQTAWIGNDHGYDHQTGIEFEVDGNPITLTDGQSVTGSEIVVTRTSQLAHPGLSLTPGSAGEAVCEWRLKGDSMTITFAWNPAFSSESASNKLEYPMAGVSTTTAEGFIKGRTLAMDADQDLSNHDGAIWGSGTTSDTALMWQPEGRFALIVHVPDTARTFTDHNMSVYIQDRAQDASRSDLYMTKAYFEHLAVPIVAGKTIRGQGVYQFAWLTNPDLTLAL